MSLALDSPRQWSSPSKILLDRLPAVVGRDPDCDIFLRDPAVSRLHCEISEINGRLVVLDRESRYGTFVNGQQVRFAHLSPGDRLCLGNTHLMVEGDGKVLRVLPPREGILAIAVRPRVKTTLR